MTKLTTGLAKELYDRYYIGESRSPRWIAEKHGPDPTSLTDCWRGMEMRLRDRSQARMALYRNGAPWSWDATERDELHTNGSRPVPAAVPALPKQGVLPTHEINIPADGLPVKLLLVVGNVRLEIQVGK